MVEAGIKFLKKNKKLKELSHFFSRIYNFCFFRKKNTGLSFFFNREGKRIFTSLVYNNIWTVQSFDINKNNNNMVYFAIITKKIKPKQKKEIFDFVEIWEYSEKNKLKKKSRFCLNEEEIWDIRWNHFEKRKRKKNFGIIALCCGFSLKILKIPNFFPSQVEIFSFSINIDLLNIFQWKICWKGSEIITGDISGKLISYNFQKKLSVRQIINFAHKNLPIGSLTIFFGKGTTHTKFLITGGFDGYLKLWNLNDCFINLFQINFSSSKILNLDFSFEEFGNLGIFVGLENGFFSTVFLKKNFLIFVQFNHQGSLWGIKIKKNIAFTLGEDGELGISEINTPFSIEKISLNLLFSNKSLPILKFKVKNKNSALQNIKKKFYSKILNETRFLGNNCILNNAGNSGIIVFYKFFMKSTFY